jgi:hypothetical protein
LFDRDRIVVNCMKLVVVHNWPLVLSSVVA